MSTVRHIHKLKARILQLESRALHWESMARSAIKGETAELVIKSFADGYKHGVDDEFVDVDAAWNRSRSIHMAHDLDQQPTEIGDSDE